LLTVVPQSDVTPLPGCGDSCIPPRRRGWRLIWIERMKTCLIVEDSEVIRKVARRIMNNLDFDAIEVANGQEALDACELGMPEMILLDWHMPVMGGMEFLQSFRPVFKKKRPYIIFCATDNDKMELARAITLGANDYVLKPYDRESIKAKIREAGLM
jgi:two-component system, chemotaxis family, chemotaxis protein CheY